MHYDFQSYRKHMPTGDSTIFRFIDIWVDNKKVEIYYNGSMSSVNKIKRIFNRALDTLKKDNGPNTLEIIDRKVDTTLPKKWFDRTVFYYRGKKEFTVCTPRYEAQYLIVEGDLIESLPNYKEPKIQKRK